MNFFDRIANGWSLTKKSFQVLKANKQLILFPLLSGVSLVLLMISFGLSLLAASAYEVVNISDWDSVSGSILIFIFYLINYFVVVFFNTALVHCTGLYFNGEEPTIQKGISFSLSRIGAIFLWALFAATVGTVLKLIQENSGMIGKIITGIIGIVWNVATFFVVPVLAYENVGPVDAFKRSASIMKEKWGESAVSSFSFGIIQFLAFLLISLPIFYLGSMVNLFLGIGMTLLSVFLIIAIMTAVQNIFIAAVYLKINNKAVTHFNDQSLDNLFYLK